MRELVDQHLDRDLTIEGMADAAGLSRAHFARSFRTATGQTPYAYLRAERIARVRTLLTGTSHPIGDIAALTGFRSQSHLARVFRNATGLTPVEYRRLG